MSKNNFIACGGTGAHVLLAMVRLHVLGSPFGFFISKKDRNFPNLFLVDQDYNEITEDGEERTAWGKVKELINTHPGRYKPSEKFCLPSLPSMGEPVAPLPVGENGDEIDPPNNKLDDKFQGSEVLKLITTKYQREKIEYDRGMMASPAVGSLLVSLKEQDTKKGSKVNNDRDYANLLDNCSKNVVICGSIVGGTGASVTPTLARDLHGKGAKVMAVLIHRWFKFRTDNVSGEIQIDAKKRNKDMVENAAGGLAYSGEKLARDLATVLVGVPNKRLVLRDYSGDNKQACKDSYAHVIGALAAIRHLLSDEAEIGRGLYGISASNPSELTGEIKIGEGKHSTLNDLVGQARCLVYVLELYCDALKKYESRQFGGVTGLMHLISTGSSESLQMRICRSVYDAVDENIEKVEKVAQELKKIKENYDGLLEWLEKLNLEYRLSPQDKKFLKIQYNHLSRIREENLPSPLDGGRRGINKMGKELGDEEYIALALFHWIADWIKAWWEKEKPLQPSSDAVEFYWPPVVAEDSKGAITGSSYPGGLVKTKERDITRILADYFQLEDVSPNGWPHPIAVADEYAFKIKRENSIAVRKLELLLLGRALNLLNLEKLNIEEGGSRSKNDGQSVSVEKLIKQERPDLAQYRLVHHRTKKKPYGFSSPETLLCPAPDTSDQDWRELWEEINDDIVLNGDWKTSKEWGHDARKARDRVATWIRLIGGNIKKNDCWKRLVKTFESEKPIAFGISEWLPISGSQGRIPLPVHGSSVIPPDGFTENRIIYGDPNDNKIRDSIEGFDQHGGFEFIKDLSVPGEEYPQSMMWREHLDLLQEADKIFAWWEDLENNQVGIMPGLQEKVIYIKNLRVIDISTIQIKTCIPLIQRPVPGSDVQKNSLKFPDFPLLPKYISLVKSSPDKKEPWIESNWTKRTNEQLYELDERNKVVRWKVHLAGRPEHEKIELSYHGVEPAEAHWMIWPNFKAENKEKHQWKAYYIYEDSTREFLEARPMLIDEGGKLSEPKKRPVSSLGPSRAIEFDPVRGVHIGGPPLALCAYDHEEGDVGLYKINLVELPKSEPEESEWKIAVDFGTSHTVSAKKGDEKNEPITLQAELDPDSSNRELELSLHISENWPEEEEESQEKSEIDMLDLWRPTYVKKGNKEDSVIPSDIWSVENLDSVQLANVEQRWEPMTHYLIPPMKLKRKDSSDHSIAGFKWRMTEGRFKGKKTWLQKKYLGMAIEIFVADLVRDRKRLPREIQFTFTYPLRGISSGDTQEYTDSVDEVLKHTQGDLGFEVSQDKMLFHSESEAAAGTVGTGIPFQVKLVADLGGGSLDIFISTSDLDDANRFEVVADSAQVGADSLLKTMAEKSEDYLPESWGKDHDTCLANLRAWMRSEGSYKLFARKHSNSRSKSLGLSGFGDGEEGVRRANASRALINRYFQSMVDFLARSLVAYVAKEFWENLENEVLSDSEGRKMELFLLLQGNGWRLWHVSDDYYMIQKRASEYVEKRAGCLWAKANKDKANQLDSIKGELWPIPNPEDLPDPKTGPVCGAVGKGKNRPDDKDFYKFPLSKVLLMREKEIDDSREWFKPLPFMVEDPEKISLRIERFDPPLCIHSPEKSDRLIVKLDNPLMIALKNDIFQKITDDNTIDASASIAATIWEKLLDTTEFKKVKKD